MTIAQCLSCGRIAGTSLQGECKHMKLKPQTNKKRKILERAIKRIFKRMNEKAMLRVGSPGTDAQNELLSLFDEKLQEERESFSNDLESLFETGHGGGNWRRLIMMLQSRYSSKLKSEEEHDH